MHEEDSFEENNFFKVLAVQGTSITVQKNHNDSQTPKG
jgi:hypothetical protein